MKKTVLTALWTLILLKPEYIRACTTVALKSEAGFLVGNSYDWKRGHGTVFLNKRNVIKVSESTEIFSRKAKWISKFASITFSQHGFEFPIGGMNEKGLVVKSMLLPSTKHPSKRSFPGVAVITDLPWVQYQLDNFTTVKEVLNNIDKLRIATVGAKLHYMVCDADGDCGVVEFIDGKTQITQPNNMTIQALTNRPYKDSLAHIQHYDFMSGANDSSLLEGLIAPTPLERMVLASKGLSSYKNEQAIDYMFSKVLNKVAQKEKGILGNKTRWQIVYNTDTLEIFFRLYPGKVYKIDFAEFVASQTEALSCQTPVLSFDLSNTEFELPTDKNINPLFTAFTKVKQSELVRKGRIDIKSKIPGLKAFMTSYPERLTKCAERSDLGYPYPL